MPRSNVILTILESFSHIRCRTETESSVITIFCGPDLTLVSSTVNQHVTNECLISMLSAVFGYISHMKTDPDIELAPRSKQFRVG